MTKEHPILFSGEMVRQILAGKQTQTRRVITPQPLWEYALVSPLYYSPHEKRHYVNFSDINDGKVKTFYFRYQPGDRLWVREAFISLCPGFVQSGCESCGQDCDKTATYYKADGEINGVVPVAWKPSIHMPRTASRITLEVVNVRAERLQDISEADAINEGVEIWGSDWPDGVQKNEANLIMATEGPKYINYMWHGRHNDSEEKISSEWPYQYSAYDDALGSYSSLWQSINRKKPGRAWADNPWVFVIEFRRIP
jgi:hypothetical protein